MFVSKDSEGKRPIEFDLQSTTYNNQTLYFHCEKKEKYFEIKFDHENDCIEIMARTWEDYNLLIKPKSANVIEIY